MSSIARLAPIAPIAPIALLVFAGCSDVEEEHDHIHEHGQPTTVILNFTPDGGGDTLSFTWADPDNAGDPQVDSILLPDGSDHNHHDVQAYSLEVEVWNELEDPAEDVTPEIEELADEHQFFFTGSAVSGPATGTNASAIIEHRYADSDEGGMPIGLVNDITTTAWGAGQLVVTLRHMPPENGEAVKIPGLARDVASDGFGAIGGDNDIRVTFPIEVQ